MNDLSKPGNTHSGSTESQPKANLIHSHATRPMVITIALSALLLNACSALQVPAHLISSESHTQSDTQSDINENFSRRLYGSVGLGASRLEPTTTPNSSWSVTDRVDPGSQVTIGADVSKNLSVEVHSTNLGSAGLSPEGAINYQMNGGSAIIYAGANRQKRDGLNAFGRVGVGAMENSAEGNVNFTQLHGTQLLVGAGAEYGWKNGIGVRGEVIVFDKDAQFAQLGVVYRLGADGKKVPILAEAPATQPAPIEEIAAASRPDADEDNDGVADHLDQCAATETGIAVNDAGCAIFNGVINGVNFESSSAYLTLTAQSLLDNVAETLARHPDVMVAISAHTDNTADADYNMSLSRQRAINVARYLISKGVPKGLMSARAFGEQLPVADNDTSEGKAQNRRVELVANRTPVI